MNKRLLKYYLTLWVLFFQFACERDDICITSIRESPDLILLMIDNNSNSRKVPPRFSIRALGTEKKINSAASDSFALPLKINQNRVEYEFTRDKDTDEENRDTIQINYDRFDTFINAACGFRSSYILESIPAIILNPGNDWIIGFTILKDTISDENSAHWGILH